MKKFNILVFPGGTEIGLEIHNALYQCKDICLYSAGQNISNHASYVFTRHFVVPTIHEEGWIEALNEIITRYEIHYIFPAYDDIIVALAENSHNLKANIVSSPLKSCQITRSKLKTYELLTDVIPVPVIIGRDKVNSYPVFLKPDCGQGSQHIQKISGESQLSFFLGQRDDYIVMEYLPGDEYTIDCFSDRERGLLFCSGRTRTRTKNGISMHSSTFHDPLFEKYANAIMEKLSLYGAWFFQLKRDQHGISKLLEIAPRIAGTMALHRVQGINFPLLSIYEQERIPIEIFPNNVKVEIDRALVNRYRHNINFGTVYIDMDDTLIFNGEVNLVAIRFLYQCLNKGKRVKLLTRHVENPYNILQKFRLSELFDEIIHCDRTTCKAEYIMENDAILIDDSYRERKAVHEAIGIFTFDCSMLEMLVDERS